MLRKWMSTTGLWPGEVFGEKVPRIVTYIRVHSFTQLAVMCIGIMYYLYHFQDDLSFIEIGENYVILFMTMLATVRASLNFFKKFGDETKTFIMSFHLIHYKHRGGYYQKMFDIIDKISHYYALCLIMATIGVTLLFNLLPNYKNYKNGVFTRNRNENTTLEFAGHFAFPGFDMNDWFYSVSLLNMFTSYIIAISINMIDLLLALMILQIIGHIQILRNNFDNLPRPRKQAIITVEETNNNVMVQKCAVVEIYNGEENDFIHTKLVECVDHHRLIVSFAKEITDLFGPILAVNCLFYLVCLCLLLLVSSRGDVGAFMRFGFLSCIIFGQLVMVSCVFEVVNIMSEKLSDNVYDIPWECMDTRNRRTVCILLNRVQTPITVTALGLVPVGVKTMAGILKTTFSYFTFLRSI